MKRIRLFSLDISQADDALYEACLPLISAERKRRADRYRFPADKRRCVFSEMLLRYAYRQSGGDPFEMQIAYRKQGKPYLSSDESFHFNLSHAGDMIVLASAADEVGVDVEKTDRMLDQERIGALIFTDEERRFLAEASDAERNERFFRLWTAKESYLKYLGTGLGTSAKRASVDLVHHRLKENEEIYVTETVLNEYIVTVCGKTDRLEYESLALSDVRA